MKSCLIVDDSGVIRKIIHQHLESFGFQCSEAQDGSVALEYCKKTFPDLIMLDWNMPVMSGIDFLRALRALPGGDKPIVIFCTTENDMGHITEAVTAGANDFIMKPFDQEILQGKLEQCNLLPAN